MPLNLPNDRSRESRVTVEKELLSSTSDEVCELWNGREIVRVDAKKPAGLPDLIVADFHTDGLSTLRLLNVRDAIKSDLIIGHHHHDPEELESINKTASSLSLNVQGTVIPKWEMWFWTIGGFVAYLFTLAFPGLATFYWKWTRKGGATVPVYAYWCFLSGSLALMIGLLACACVVKAATHQVTFWPQTRYGTQAPVIQQVIRLQLKCQVGSQDFPACVILNKSDNLVIRTSRLSRTFQSKSRYK